MKRFLLMSAMVLTVCVSAIAGINEKLSSSTQLLIAERDGLISLDMKVPGPKSMSRAPMLRTQPVERLIAAPERINGEEMVSAFIHINPNATSQIESLGVIVQERFNDFVVAMVPVARIEQIAEVSTVKEINVARKMTPRTNMARYYTNTDDVLNLSNDAINAGLPMAFKGSGVVVGVIDGGIDFQHTMFKDADGNSRIKRAYIARSASSFTTYTSVGTTPTTDDSSDSHGTHTAGGSEITVNGTVYGGMAPESDLVLVGLSNYTYNTNIAMGIKYIFDYADSQNMPAVCSISLGTHFGPHDGTGELASTYAQYAGSNPNHIILVAAGNEAGGSYGKQYSTGQSSSSTPFTTTLNGLYYLYQGYGTSYLNRMYNGYEVFYARTAGKTLACKLHVVNTSNNSVVWTSGAITSSTTSVSGLSTYFSGTIQVTISRDSYSGKYYVMLNHNQMTKKSSYTGSQYVLAVSVYPTSGSCVVDGWIVSGDNVFGTASGTYGTYTLVAGNDDCSIGDESASDDIISVGAYCSKRTIRDYNGSNHTLSIYTVNDIAYFSSYQAPGCGPTGVAKPDICAPGATIVAGVNYYDNTTMNDGYADYGMYLVSKNGHSSLASMDGTSMSTPCAAGIVALYLQAAKYVGTTLNTSAIRDVFANTAIHDNYTTKKNFGPYGKIDALEGVKYILGDNVPHPALTVSPESLTFSASVGTPVTQTFTVTGTDLTSAVNISVSGNSAYTVSPSTITAAQAMAGATVTVTYSPTISGTHTGTVTVSSTAAASKTVALTGSATLTPTLAVSPSSMSFETTVDSPMSQTFTVTGTNLTDNVTIDVTEGSEDFSVDKFTILRSAVANGVEVTVTYDPLEAGTQYGVVTVSSAGAQSQTITLTGVAREPVRSISVDPAALTFEALPGQTLTQTFHLQGSNVNSSLSLTLNDDNGVYSINRTTVTASRANAGIDVTVTYKPTVGGTHNATVTISGGGADPVTVTLNGTTTIVKYVPVMLQPNDAYVTMTAFRAEWTDETPSANVSSYTLEVNAADQTDQGDATYRLITGIQPGQFYWDVDNLLSGGIFQYKVKALYTDGTESAWSNIQEVALLSHGYQLGDVDHDGKVGIADVTALIDYLLSGTGACEICADVDESGAVNIADVTALIDMLLSTPNNMRVNHATASTMPQRSAMMAY